MGTPSKSQPPVESLVPLAIAAEEVGLSVKTLRRRISDGTIHGYRVGRFIRVNLEELKDSLFVEMPATKR